VEKTKALKVGHGAEKGTTMGPVTTPRGLAKAEEQAADALKRGAKLVLGTGKAYKNSRAEEGAGEGKGVGGYFMDPTILTDMNTEMLLSRDETFAPVCGVFKFEKEEEAVRWPTTPPWVSRVTHSPRTSTGCGACLRIWKPA